MQLCCSDSLTPSSSSNFFDLLGNSRLRDMALHCSLYTVDEHISDKLASLIKPFTVGCCFAIIFDFRLSLAKELGFATCNPATEDFAHEAKTYYPNGW